jgi:hypothetical protein
VKEQENQRRDLARPLELHLDGVPLAEWHLEPGELGGHLGEHSEGDNFLIIAMKN